MTFNYEVEAGEYINAGIASSRFKKVLKQLGIPTEIIRKVAIAMYEAEINMVIHANGGHIQGEITSDKIHLVLKDDGPGIEDINLAMKAGYSTASDEARNMGFGAGMGLPNIKRYSDEMFIESVIGNGTTLDITFLLHD